MKQTLGNQALRQRGATLVTVLMFLVLMTLVSVSATKISIMDVLASSNEQQQALLFQQTENSLKNMATITNLAAPMMETDGATFDDSGVYKLSDDSTNSKIELQIVDRDMRYYPCGSFGGKAVSIGSSVPICDLYDFSVRVNKNNSSARDVHHRGAGKQKPNPRKNSYL